MLTREHRGEGALVLTGTVGAETLEKVRAALAKNGGAGEILVSPHVTRESVAIESVHRADAVLWVEVKHASIRSDILIGFCIKKHSRYIAASGCVNIINICHNLVEINGMETFFIKALLHCLTIVFRVDDENLIILSEKDICPHFWKILDHIIICTFINIPVDLRCPYFRKI